MLMQIIIKSTIKVWLHQSQLTVLSVD